MKLSSVVVTGLASGANARKFQENDALAAEGMLKLVIHLAKNAFQPQAPVRWTRRRFAGNGKPVMTAA